MNGITIQWVLKIFLISAVDELVLYNSPSLQMSNGLVLKLFTR